MVIVPMSPLSIDEKFNDLCNAVRESDVNSARSGYEGVDVNRPMASWESRSPLLYAIDQLDLAMFEFLIEDCHANASFQDDKQRNAVHHAVEAGNDDVLRVILNRCDVNLLTVDAWSQTPLHLAVHHANYDMTKALSQCCPKALAIKSSADKNQYTPLELARSLKHVKIVELLQSKTSSMITKKKHTLSCTKTSNSSNQSPIISFSDYERPQQHMQQPVTDNLGVESEKRQLMEARLANLSREQNRLSKEFATNSKKPVVCEGLSSSIDDRDLSASIIVSNPPLMKTLDDFVQSTARAKREWEEHSKIKEKTIVPKPFPNLDRELNVGLKCQRKEVEAQIKALVTSNGAPSIKSSLRALLKEFPAANDEVTTLCKMLDEMTSNEHVQSPVEIFEVERVVERCSITALKEVFASDKRPMVIEAKEKSLVLAERYTQIEKQLDDARNGDNKRRDSAERLEDRLRKAYCDAIRHAGDSLSLCSSRNDSERDQRLMKAMHDGEQVAQRTRVLQMQARVRVDKDLDKLGNNTAALRTQLEALEEKTKDEELAATRADAIEAREATRIADEFSNLLNEELERQARVRANRNARQTRELRKRSLLAAGDEITKAAQECRDGLQMLASVHEHASKDTDKLKKLVEFAVMAAKKKYVMRSQLNDATSATLTNQLSVAFDRYEEMTEANINSLEVQLSEIYSDINANEEQHKRATRRGSSNLSDNLSAVMRQLKEESNLIEHRLNKLKRERATLLGVVKKYDISENESEKNETTIL